MTLLYEKHSNLNATYDCSFKFGNTLSPNELQTTKSYMQGGPDIQTGDPAIPITSAFITVNNYKYIPHLYQTEQAKHWKLFINLLKEKQDSKIREWKKKLGAEGESIQKKDYQQKEKKQIWNIDLMGYQRTAGCTYWKTNQFWINSVKFSSLPVHWSAWYRLLL